MPPVRIVRIVSRLNVGGPARQAILLARGLEAEGFSTLLVAGTPDPSEGDLAPLAQERGVRLLTLPSMRRALRPDRDLLAFARLVRILRAERPAIVHTHTAKAGALGRLAAAIARVPIRLHTFHGHTLHGYFGRTLSRANALTERSLARLSTRLVAVSERVHDDLLAWRIAPAEKIVILRAGIDLEPYLAIPIGRDPVRDESFRGEIGVSHSAPLVLAVGRLAPVKRLDLLLRAAALLPLEVHLAFAGDGPERERLQALASSLGLSARVRWLGFRSDLVPLYATADLVALSSANEGLPLSLVEAMASGRAVVATEVGGVPELVARERTGLLVPPADPEALARALSSLLADPRRRAEMGARGRARVRERYAAERFLRDAAALYRKLLEEIPERASPSIRGPAPQKIA